jgi:hypothetical protein
LYLGDRILFNAGFERVRADIFPARGEWNTRLRRRITSSPFSYTTTTKITV